jgi:hypothetical protein
MKHGKYSVVLALSAIFALLFMPATYAAVPPPGDDLFGIYADTNFNDDSSDENPTFVFGSGEIQVYVYLTNVSATTVGAFEFALSYAGPGEPPTMIDDGLPDMSINIGIPPDFIVGLGTPLYPDEYGHAILMAPTFFVYDVDPVYVSVMPVSVPSVPNQISYLDYFDVDVLLPMYPASGNFIDPIFAFNTGLVGTEDATWSTLKALYR